MNKILGDYREEETVRFSICVNEEILTWLNTTAKKSNKSRTLVVKQILEAAKEQNISII